MIENKKAVTPIVILVSVGFVLLVFYGLLYLPFFKLQKEMVNYILILVLWVLVQAIIIYGFYYVGNLGFKGFNLFKNKLQSWVLIIKKNIGFSYRR
jgi:hypothetical protein